MRGPVWVYLTLLKEEEEENPAVLALQVYYSSQTF